MAAAAIALAACSGGGGLNEDEAAGLQQELKDAQTQAAADAAARVTAETKAVAAQAAKVTAEAEAEVARTAQVAAVTAQRLTEETAAGQVSDAEADVETAQKVAKDALDAKDKADAALIVAQDKQKAAEDERDAALADEVEAQRQLRLAQQATTAEERRRQEAEAEKDRLAQENEEVRQQVTRADARLVLEGLATAISGAAVTVEPHYNAVARITSIMPRTTFVNPTTGSLLGWRKTAFAKNERPNIDRLEVHSNVEAPTFLPFRDSDYNDGTANDIDIANTNVVAPFETGVAPSVVIDNEGDVVGWLDIPDGSTREDAASGAFPRSSRLAMTYTLIDRGQYTTVDRDMGRVPPEYRGPIRNLMVDPQRYEFERSGTLGGANGTYRCADNTLPTCSVQNTGNHLVFQGPWTFRPSSASSRVRIEDEAYMYFGWWSRHATATPAWSFFTFHDGDVAGDISGVTGSATYRGPAAGYYAIYEPNSEGSEYGDFTATASLTADFDTSPEWVQGTIDQFSGHPNWSLTLERLDIDPSTGRTTATGDPSVTWTINNTPAASNLSWEAEFYSNIAPADRTGVDNIMPSGIAGTFDATYDQTGRLTGAFGAHCVDVVCRP